MILGAIPLQAPSPHWITLLRMFAQGEDPGLARAAIERLGRIRSIDAAEALASLAQTLPPSLSELAERNGRKLHLSGVQNSRPAADTAPRPAFLPDGRDAARWRALLSPVDGAGSQVIWFIREEDAQGHRALISILAQDGEGIAASFGSTEVPAGQLPDAKPVGSLHRIVQTEDAVPLLLLEVPPETGRRWVHLALESNWAAGRQTPLEYRLTNPLIWATEPVGYEEQDWQAASAGDRPPQAVVALLDHPAFETWLWHTPTTQDLAGRLGAKHSLPARQSPDCSAGRTRIRAGAGGELRQAPAGHEPVAGLGWRSARCIAGIGGGRTTGRRSPGDHGVRSPPDRDRPGRRVRHDPQKAKGCGEEKRRDPTPATCLTTAVAEPGTNVYNAKLATRVNG